MNVTTWAHSKAKNNKLKKELFKYFRRNLSHNQQTRLLRLSKKAHQTFSALAGFPLQDAAYQLQANIASTVTFEARHINRHKRQRTDELKCKLSL